MKKFNVGDKVRCIQRVHPWETEDVVTVGEPSSRHASDYEYITIVEYQQDHLSHNFDQNRYELVQAAAAIPYAAPTTARKDDSGKLDMNLLDDMPRALKAVVEVMQWAIVDKKPVPYVRGSWLGVEPDRYRAAIKRHERAAAEQATADTPARLQRDDETHLLHLAHTACSAMMALENTLREMENQ